MRLLWKLLRCHLSMAQTVGFTLAGLVGMAIVLTALQAYRDVLPVFDRPDSFMRGDYLVLSKQVGALQAIGLGSSDFTAEELADLRDWGLRFCAALRLRFCFRCSTERRSAGKSIA